LTCLKQENPGIKSRDFQEPKTKIYETFYLQPKFMATGLYDKNRCKSTTFFKNASAFFQKSAPFYGFWKNFPNPLSFEDSFTAL